MSATKLETTHNSQLQIQYLNSQEIEKALNPVLHITSSCRKGFITMIQNSVGGPLTMTSTSERLLQSLIVSKPVIRLIVSAVQGHLKHFSDGGHFVSMLIVLLVTKSIKVNISPSYLTELYDRFFMIVLDAMNSELCKIELNISSLKQVTCFVKSVIGRKPLCKLNQQDIDYLTKLLIRIFVSYLPGEKQTGSWQKNIHIICNDGPSVCKSSLIHGLLLENHGLSRKIVDKFMKNSIINVVVVTVSMSGDTEEVIDTEYEIIGNVSAGSTMLNRIMKYCERCKEENIEILFCQKVIHPRVKNYLCKMNILPVERIGGQMIPFLLKLTGAQGTRSFTFSRAYIGYLDKAERQEFYNKCYLSLIRETSPIATLILTNDHEESVQELKSVCCSVLHSLERLAYSSYVVPGGGCWEINTSYILQKQVNSQLKSIVEQYGCTKTKVLCALESCCTSLQTIAKSVLKDSEIGMTDCLYHHFWRVPKEVDEEEITCSCGLFCLDISLLVDLNCKKERELLKINIQEKYDTAVLDKTVLTDQLAMCINAVKTSFITANSILSTKLIICDGS